MIQHYLRSIPELFRIAFAQLIAYRAEMTIWILTALLPLIMLALWNAVVQQGGPIAGYGEVEMARYFTATLIVRQLTGAWIFWMLNWEIRSGQLSVKLMRPVHPLWQEGILMLSAMPWRMFVLTPLLGLLVWWKPALVAFPDLPAFALFLVSSLLAWILSFLLQAIMGMLAFWLDQTDGLFGLWFAVWSLFSGYVAPLDLFPAGWATVLHWLPFRSMLATPVEILGGFITFGDAVADVGIQLMWVVVMFVLASWVWRRGVKRYGAFGA